MDWSIDTIGRLRNLWTEGHPTQEIARRLGVSKNAVVGKAHRLDLPARPSPIRRDGQGNTQPAVRRPPRRVQSLPPLPSLEAPPPALPVAGRPAQPAPQLKLVSTAEARPPAPQPAPPAPPPSSYSQPLRRDGRGCQFPIGEPGRHGFHFCDADLDPIGGSYCEEHRKLCCIRIRDRREDAA